MGYEDELIMFNSLSDKQREIVFKKQGRFVVRACPGSGKTYTVAARFAKEINNWDNRFQGIATISFTNIAWQEIEKKVTNEFGVDKPIPYPHFLGTIDRFINQFIFLPFGHLVMGCITRPTLVGAPHGSWKGRTFYESLFDKISFNINGDIFLINNRVINAGRWNNEQAALIMMKKNLSKSGFATQLDSNYYAMKVLEIYPQIAKSLVLRFNNFIIDEAQDTSEIQMKIFDILIENGLNEIMIVGDPDQAIYEFHDAEPKLLIEKYDKWKKNSIILNENRRSSQNICNFTVHLSSLIEPSVAITEGVKDEKFSPNIIPYSPKNLIEIKQIIGSFLSECKRNDIKLTQENVAVLTRGKDFLNLVNGRESLKSGPNIWDKDDMYSGDISYGQYLWDNNVDKKKAFTIIRNTILKMELGRKYINRNELITIIEQKGFVNIMKDTYKFIDGLPSLKASVGEWVDKLQDKVGGKYTNILYKAVKKNRDLIFDEIYVVDSVHKNITEYTLNTIHGVKGETFEAVLVLLKSGGGSGSSYKKLLENNIVSTDSEELRIVYVGITRPRKLLYLAVPEKAEDAFKKKFYPKF